MLLRHVPLPLGYRTLYGERARNRTSNLVVKSHLLCLLSYTPHVYGADCRSRTDDLRFTRPLLWPSELSRLKWSGWQDLNLRPSAPKADALPSCATSRKSFMARRPGLEPGMKGSKPLVLPLHHRRICGGDGRDRTDDLMLAKHPLSQLSYTPIIFVAEGEGVEPSWYSPSSG